MIAKTVHIFYAQTAKLIHLLNIFIKFLYSFYGAAVCPSFFMMSAPKMLDTADISTLSHIHTVLRIANKFIEQNISTMVG